MTKNILITRKIPNIAVSILQQKGYVIDVNQEDKILSQQDIISLLAKKPYDAVITLLTDKIDKVVYESAPTVKIFANYASGYDNIDVAEAKARGITVTNAPTVLSAEAVAQHTIGFMFALATRTVEADKFVRAGKYDGWAPLHFLGTNLFGKTLGLVGAGRIGERVAYFCKGLGLKIIYTDVGKNEKIEKEYGAVFYNSLDELLPQADFISLHVPLMPSTKHLINEEKLHKMKPTAFLINTSRGPVIDEYALLKALKEKVIAGAGLDVFEFEPKPVPGLIELDNVVLTPHIASANMDAREAMAETNALDIIDFFEGKVPKNIVNK
jgi:glyoxylate reductase